ncbi:hypothetical protein BKG94_06290 [Rodentibacter ratti]|uniref:hypothetical protein n=1 Tax=Rodentibacter ratti TaxID=1906745 RepID=UPI000985AF86|nr:hypothetical protein [Rodentibacter ratti]OOF88748.1 hypothetical protein BKG94_06290 [Rodentibacter ratti]
MPFLSILLPIAYFIGSNETSLLVTLLLSCVLSSLVYGNFIHLVPRIVGIFSFSPVIYTKFTPESFIGFIGLGIAIYVIISLILFIFRFIWDLLGLLLRAFSIKQGN